MDRLPAGTTAVADLRTDAWGHGLPVVAAELLGAGTDLLRVDDEQTAHVLAEAGVSAVSATAPPNLDALTVFGLPGGAPDAEPVMRLHGTVLSVKPLRAGEGVSYGYAFRATADTHVALVTGGYAQGIARSLGNRAHVVIAGERRAVVGRVAMDVCVVDVGDAPVRRGDEVVFFGDPARGEPALAEWVAATGMSASELIIAVGLHAVRENVA